MNLYFRSILLPTILSICGNAALADVTPVTDKPTQLTTITETAQRTVSSGMQIVTGEEIRTRYFNLEGFLKSLTGMQVQHSGGLGDPVLLSVRGASSRQTTMLVNGIRINDAQGGGYDLSQIPTELIQRVEISSTGSNGGLYDSAIGGTINIITREQDYQHRVSAGIGNHGYRNLSAQGAVTPAILVFAGTEYSNNNFDYPVPAPWNGDVRDSEEALNNARFFRHSAQVALAHGDIVGKLSWRHQNKEIPDYFRNSPENRAHFDTRELKFVTSNSAQPQSGLFSVLWSAALSGKNETYRDPESSIGLGEDDNRYRLRHAELSVAPQWKKERLEVETSLGAEFDEYQSRYVNDEDSRNCTTPQGSCDQTARQSIINLNISPTYVISQQWLLNTSAYHRRYQASNERTHADNAARTENKDNFNGASASITHLTGHSETQLSARRSLRIPSLYERYGDRGLMLGNDDLMAETAKSVSLDLRIFNTHGDISVSIFHRETDNTIVPVYDSRGVGRYLNTSDSVMQGIETDISYRIDLNSIRLLPSLSTATYSSKLMSDVRAFDGQQVPGIYHDRYVASLAGEYRNHTLSLSYELAGNLFIDSSNNNKGDIRRIIDLNYSFENGRWISGFNIQNLADSQFRDFSNRPVAGRQLRGFTTYRF